VQNFHVKKGLVLIDPNNLANDIAINIVATAGNPAWRVEINNFGEYLGDGFLIF